MLIFFSDYDIAESNNIYVKPATKSERKLEY